MVSKKIYIFVGIAGSGKTTLIQKFAEIYAIKKYDILKIMMPYIKKYGSVTERNRDILDKVVNEWINSFSRVEFDALEFAEGSFLPKIITALEGKDIVVIYCRCPLLLCMKRNKLRSRIVPEHYLRFQSRCKAAFYKKMQKKYHYRLITIDMRKDSQSCLRELLRAILNLN